MGWTFKGGCKGFETLVVGMFWGGWVVVCGFCIVLKAFFCLCFQELVPSFQKIVSLLSSANASISTSSLHIFGPLTYKMCMKDYQKLVGAS